MSEAASAPARSSTSDAIVDLDAVSVWFGDVNAVGNVSIQVRPGEQLCILGRTGSGKSTVMRLISGSLVPTSGSVKVLGVDPARDGNALQGRVAMAFQTPRLLPWRTALANAAVGLQILGVPRAERRERAQEWLERVHLGHAPTRYPAQLSGGMRQRVSLARAFSVDPELVLLDEPFSALDEVTARGLRETFVDLAKAAGTTGVMVTHNIEEAFSVADRVLVFAEPARIVGRFDVADYDIDDHQVMRSLRADVHELMASNDG